MPKRFSKNSNTIVCDGSVEILVATIEAMQPDKANKANKASKANKSNKANRNKDQTSKHLSLLEGIKGQLCARHPEMEAKIKELTGHCRLDNKGKEGLDSEDGDKGPNKRNQKAKSNPKGHRQTDKSNSKGRGRR